MLLYGKCLSVPLYTTVPCLASEGEKAFLSSSFSVHNLPHWRPPTFSCFHPVPMVIYICPSPSFSVHVSHHIHTKHILPPSTSPSLWLAVPLTSPPAFTRSIVFQLLSWRKPYLSHPSSPSFPPSSVLSWTPSENIKSFFCVWGLRKCWSPNEKTKQVDF